MELFQLCTIIINGPQAERHHVAGLNRLGSGAAQKTRYNFQFGRNAVGIGVVIAQQHPAEYAIDKVSELPLCDKLIVGIRRRDTDLYIEIKFIVQALCAGLIEVGPGDGKA